MEDFEWSSMSALTQVAGDGGAALNRWIRAHDHLLPDDIAAALLQPHITETQRSIGEFDSGAAASSASENRHAIPSSGGSGTGGNDEVDQEAEPCPTVTTPADQEPQRKRPREEAACAPYITGAATIAAVAAAAAATETGSDEHCREGRKPRSANKDVENDGELDWKPRTMRKTTREGGDDGYGSGDGGKAGSGSGASGSSCRIKPKSMTERQRRDRISDALTQLRVAVDGHGDTASMLNHAVHKLHTLEQTNKKLELQLLQHRLRCSCGSANAPVHCHHL